MLNKKVKFKIKKNSNKQKKKTKYSSKIKTLNNSSQFFFQYIKIKRKYSSNKYNISIKNV